MPAELPQDVAEAVIRNRNVSEMAEENGHNFTIYKVDDIMAVLAHLDAQAAEIAALRGERDEWKARWEAKDHSEQESLTARVHERWVAATERAERLAALIRWALGESPDGMLAFPRRPEKIQGKPHPLYWWRTELRRMFNAALAEPAAGQED